MKFLPFISLISAAQAHGVYSTLFIDGTRLADGKCLRTSFTLDNATSPITNLDSPELACGIAGQTPAPDTCDIKAGAKLSFEFRLWASGTPAGTIDPSHLGPMAIYAKRVQDSTEDPTGPGWFKLWDYGYDGTMWATQKLIANDGIVSVVIPESLESGIYFVRPEIIALHNLAAGPAQFYTSCAQISVQGGSKDFKIEKETERVSIPGYVKASDPAVNFNSHPDAVKQFPYILAGPKSFGDGTNEVAFGPLDAPVVPILPSTSTSISVVTPTPTPTSTSSIAYPSATGTVLPGHRRPGNGTCRRRRRRGAAGAKLQ
ncbi:glycosyl hydrolase family 61-domain-containing protein [Poronia punctata]|nr:glycosyl hydrolase family 61-domain-containing protein [Poronia punctata]